MTQDIDFYKMGETDSRSRLFLLGVKLNMAWITERKRKSGTAFIIEFTLDGVRRSLFLSAKYPRDVAEDVRRVVDRCVVALETGASLDRQSIAWLNSAPVDLRDRFDSAGLVKSSRRMTLKELYDAYYRSEERSWKENTYRNKQQTTRRFFEVVDERTAVDKFDRSEARAFVSTIESRYCEATRAGIIKDAKRVFNWAVERQIIEQSPFAGIAKGTFKNKSREFFITREDYNKMLEVATPEQRALLALYRIGGLRKNEALAVEWNDIDWLRGRLLVRSPKTERYEGRGTRVIPLFPELREQLETLWASLPEGSPAYVISHNRTTITKQIERIVFYAGLTRWSRLIQNMRSSRAIEVYNEFGDLAESEWIGHSQKTARDHYLRLLESDYERATKPAVKQSGQSPIKAD